MPSESVNAATIKPESRTKKPVRRQPWLRSRDILVTILVLALGGIGLFLPERRWPFFAKQLARRRLVSTAKLTEEELETVGVVVGHGKGDWIEQRFRRDWLAHKYLSWIQLLACYRPWGWRPKTRLIGRQHVEDALADGQGVILFTANFVYKDLMTKAALDEAGYKACHLCRDSHGFAESRLGKRLLNPIYTMIERRFLKERLVFSDTRTKEVNALIRERLRQNEALMVTVTPLGRRVDVLPFLHGRIRIATGALNFACEAGSPVLPVFTIRRPDGRIETVIEHPLKRPKKGTRAEEIQTMLEDYVPRLETYVAQFPDQFAFPTSKQHGEVLIEPWKRASSSSKRALAQSSVEALPEAG